MKIHQINSNYTFINRGNYRNITNNFVQGGTYQQDMPRQTRSQPSAPAPSNSSPAVIPIKVS